MTSSITSSVTLDMNLKPVDVKIVSFKRTLTSGEKTEVICQSRGSRPPATLNWFLNNEPVTHFVSQSFSEDGNLTTSILNFVPFPNADGQVLKCQSESAITGQVFMTDGDDHGDGEDEDAGEGGGSSAGIDENGDQVKSSSGSNRSTLDPVIDASRHGTSDEELMKRKRVMKGKKGSNNSGGSSSKIANQSVPSKSTTPDSSSSGSMSGVPSTSSKSKSSPVSSSGINSTSTQASKSSGSKSYSSLGKSKTGKHHHPHQISDEWQLQIFCKFLLLSFFFFFSYPGCFT